MQVCTSLQADNHASTPLLKFFLQAGCPSCHPTNSVKALKARMIQYSTINYIYALSKANILRPLNGLFSRTTWLSRYPKGKASLDLNEAKDDGVSGCGGISWTICKQSAHPTSLQTDNQANISKATCNISQLNLPNGTRLDKGL